MSILKASGERDGRYTSMCDVCNKSTITGTSDDKSDRALLESRGWRWRPSEPGPLDTCPECLKAGH